MHPCVLQRFDYGTLGGEGLHQPDGDFGVVGILGRTALEETDRSLVVLALHRAPGSGFEHPSILVAEAIPLFLCPALEVVRPWQMESLEEWPPIALDRSFRSANPDRVVELGVVGGDQVGVEPHLLLAEEECIGIEVVAEGVERLGQRVAAPIFVAVGPEVSEELLAVDAPLRCDGQEGEHRQPPRLGRGSGQRPLLSGHI